MIDLTPLAPAVFEHAQREQPRECCGLAVIVKGRLRYWPCRNISVANLQFEIDPNDYADAEDAGEIVGVCHSHIYEAPLPSEADRVMCERTAVPWLIVNYPTGKHHQHNPQGYSAPLVGRTYTHGVLDCYELVVDYYRQELAITLPQFVRNDGWWENGQNLYLENFGKAGFTCVGLAEHTDIRQHDVLLMRVASPVPNHAAIYLGENVILQHVYGRLSSRDVYGGYWLKNTTHVLRHQSQLT